MPTPDDDTRQLPHIVVQRDRSAHATCPPDNGRVEGGGTHSVNRNTQNGSSTTHSREQAESVIGEAEISGQAENRIDQDVHTRMEDIEQEQSSSDGQSPMSSTTEVRDVELRSSPSPQPSIRPLVSTHSTNHEFSNIRQRPSHTSSFLRAGSKFTGKQRSDRQEYNVEVEIKHVDMNESFLCGYLRIEGLTQDHPTLTTYFEGEIIGPKYTFQTKHDAWGATDKTDMQHWARFPAWRPLAKQAKKPDFHYKNCAQRENIFMRWKEYFLVPDHRVREILGASFEGFYYICFNQVAGTLSGIYFHAKSEKFQQLELTHVNDKGCLASVEFR